MNKSPNKAMIEPNKKLKVIQCYTVNIACEQIRMIAVHPELELVGALVHHPEKAGLDVGSIAGIDNTGIITTNKLDDILALEADVVLYNAPYESYDEVIPILASGKNLITVTGGNNTQDTPQHDAIVSACEKGGASFMGSGINPGLAPDVLPFVASSLCETVDHVHVYAGGNISGIAAGQLEMMGFGKTPDEVRESSMFIDFVAESYTVTTKLLARGLSFDIDDVLVEIDVHTPISAIEGHYPIAEDRVAGVRLSTIGVIEGKPCVTVECTWFFGCHNLPAEWLGAARDSGSTVKVSGDVDVELNLDIDLKGKKGFNLTAARVFNDIPMIVAAPVGPLTFLEDKDLLSGLLTWM